MPTAQTDFISTLGRIPLVVMDPWIRNIFAFEIADTPWLLWLRVHNSCARNRSLSSGNFPKGGRFGIEQAVAQTLSADAQFYKPPRTFKAGPDENAV